MSIAGIRSNRGDSYQKLVAFSWALEVLSNENYQWLEVDSITYLVDDIVIGRSDGKLIACQCKKNQVDFEAWSITDLASELNKAARLLGKNKNAEIHFYSRNNFGKVGKLKEHSTTQHNESAYKASLSIENQKTDTILSQLLSSIAPNLSTYEFLCRTEFETSNALDRMESQLRERLRNIVSNPAAAFNAIWFNLDQLGARMRGDGSSASVPHRLTKRSLEDIIHQSGALLAPTINIAEVRASFSNVSAIGRSWRRDIGGQRIHNPIAKEILATINAGKRSILVTGLPGSGKTCAMLEVQEILEQRAQCHSDILPIFIQSREFADLETSQERQALGLSEQWVNQIARISESAKVAVIIDSLDVLSIAREHRALTYFLAQIDRLLLIPNISVIAACRDFDRRYDYRIAERRWDCELKCSPLDWNNDITPLLERLGIDTTAIDSITRELIRNHRELALFIDLAQRDSDFNVITSQALAQRYLDVIVRSDASLGDCAIQAIETIAAEMLESRSLAVPYQRFSSSQKNLRSLCSLNVLQQTQDGKLTFGHQTLLDVLVISGALRSGVTLNQFIQGLPPVPFVRPSIRSFVAQLALGGRREFRKQIRTVLTGSTAFHIRRLVAESFSEQSPVDDDWPLIRDLREKHSDIFQVIYSTAKAIEWHNFWLKHLVPILKTERDTKSYTVHAYHISRWKNDEVHSVLSFWHETLSLDWLDSAQVAGQLPFYLYEIKTENLAPVVPLLQRLLNMPHADHGFLGHLLARCVETGTVEDDLLWSYIIGRVSEEDILKYRFDNKLRCQTHEFDSHQDDFVQQRMEKSTRLLDLAVATIEKWSNIRKSRYGETETGYQYGFLSETSYAKTHSQRDMHHENSLSTLLNAVEASIYQHVKTNSTWWKQNREHLCLNNEGALIYFFIQACTKFPEANTDLIARTLCDKNIYESELSYELGELINSAFILLDKVTQDTAMTIMLTVHDNFEAENSEHSWILKKRSELIIATPSHLRSPEAQALVDKYEKEVGIADRQPHIRFWGGFVRAPFSFEVFLDVSDRGVLRLLAHYSDYSDSHGADFLIGGEREVGIQLKESSSRNPTRFLSLLSNHWTDIPKKFRDDILDGVATYLSYRYGNLQNNENWLPIEEPDAFTLANCLLNELEAHSHHWRLRRSAANALEACANVVKSSKDAERLIFLITGFEQLNETNPISGNNISLISLGINMAKGKVAEALMILASDTMRFEGKIPDLLYPTLLKFAEDRNPAIRALIIRRLPYLQSKDFEFGWNLFDVSMRDADRLWQIAEPCLYYSYQDHFSVVKPLLTRLRLEGRGEDLETWGRISALCSLSQQIDFSEFIDELKFFDSAEAWLGAATVWANNENIKRHREECIAGLNAGLSSENAHALIVSRKMERLFRNQHPPTPIPLNLIKNCFYIFEKDSNNERKHHRLFGLHEWLNATSQNDPEQALAAAKIYLSYIRNCSPYFYDHDNSLTKLITRLFAEAEEREESDEGAMLMSVVELQDMLLSLGVNGMAEWLKAAERP